MEVTGDQECRTDNIIKYNQLIRSLTIYGNIVKTLGEYRKDKFKRCSIALYQPLYDVIESLEYETKIEIMKLRYSIKKDKFMEAIPFYIDEALSNEVFKYLVSNPGSCEKKWIKDKKLSKGDLTLLYTEKIGSICVNLSEGLKGSIEFYQDHIANEIGLFRLSEAPAQFWTVNSLICKDSLTRQYEIVSDLLKLIDEPKRRKGLIKCSRNDNDLVKMYCNK